MENNNSNKEKQESSVKKTSKSSRFDSRRSGTDNTLYSDDKSNKNKDTSSFSFIQVGILLVITTVIVSLVSGGMVLGLSESGDEGVKSIIPRPTVSDSVAVSATTDEAVDASIVYNRTHGSVVSIYSNSKRSGSSQGSGFVYPGGYIITNYHVIEDTKKIYINYARGEWSKAQVVGYDKYTDIAVLRPDKRPDYARPLPLADDIPKRGQKVYAIGSPNGLKGSITSGIVSGVKRSSSTASGFSIPDTIQTDAALNPGNSGGPLLNRRGVVVGVNRAREGENIGYAISSRLTEKVANSIIKSGEHEHPYVGIQTVDLSPRLSEKYNISRESGLLVTKVIDGGPAEGYLTGPNSSESNQGVPTGGDIIVSVEGETVDTNEDLARILLLTSEPGDTITMTVINKSGDREVVEFELGDRPKFDSG